MNAKLFLFLDHKIQRHMNYKVKSSLNMLSRIQFCEVFSKTIP